MAYAAVCDMQEDLGADGLRIRKLKTLQRLSVFDNRPTLHRKIPKEREGARGIGRSIFANATRAPVGILLNSPLTA
jgi:hypothetical protein